MTPQSLVDAAVNPNVAVPVTGAGAVASLLDALPHLVTLGWLAYIVVLVAHKLWKWRQEWIAAQTKIEANDDA